MAKSAKAKVTAQLLDKRSRQQLTERTEKAEEARFEGLFRCNTFAWVCVFCRSSHVCCLLYVLPWQAQQRAHLDLAPVRQRTQSVGCGDGLQGQRGGREQARSWSDCAGALAALYCVH